MTIKIAASAEWTVTEGVAFAFATEKLSVPSVSFFKKSKIRSGVSENIYFDSLTNPSLTRATPHQSVLSEKHIEYYDCIFLIQPLCSWTVVLIRTPTQKIIKSRHVKRPYQANFVLEKFVRSVAER